jgi:hypothetical protein
MSEHSERRFSDRRPGEPSSARQIDRQAAPEAVPASEHSDRQAAPEAVR